VSDSPDAYEGQPGYDFIKLVPTVWDETRFVGGDIDSYVAVARRKDKDWYVGLMGNEQARDVTVPLSFLREGRFKARIWLDGASPTALDIDEKSVAPGDALALKLAPSGGAAVRITR
jgi:alpha-glucosidase